MLSTELNILECASILSAVGTLGIAGSSLYQLKRNKRDAIHPIIYPESIQFETDKLLIRLRNYGSGPAIDVSFRFTHGSREELVDRIYRQGSIVKFLNIAPDETEELELTLARPVTSVTIRVNYTTVLRERLHRMISCSQSQGITDIKGSRW